jgi:lysyl-tRNA synthetase class 2
VKPTVAALTVADVGEGHANSRLTVSGRVTATEPYACQLADALASLRVVFRTPVALSSGDLIVVDGRYLAGSLVDAELCERCACPEPRGDGDFARFAWQGVAKNLGARARAQAVIREYFAAEHFLEVETPLRVSAPGVDLHLDAIAAAGGYLITSPELHMKRLLAGGLPRVFQFAKTSRLGELGALHQPEFTLLEWYRAFSELDSVLADTEALVVGVAEAIRGSRSLALPDGRVLTLNPPFPRITVRDAFREHAGIADAVDLAHSDEARYFELLVARVEPALARESSPIVLEKYPANQASLARLDAHDASVALRFELYAGGVELCNGFDELTDADEQRRRFDADHARREREGRPTYPVDESFLAALRAGMPRAGGNALGFDRLLMLAVGARSLDEVIAFPAATC